MVFCGRPSKGCASCRKRRIKCDQIRPACSQCLRSSKICAGYRDQLDLSFRDESQRVINKIQLQSSEVENAKITLSQYCPRNAPQASSPTEAFDKFQTWVLLRTSATRHSLPDPQRTFSDQGIHFFFSTFVTILLDHHAVDQFSAVAISHIIPWNELHANESMYNAVSSVGYAGLGNVTNDQKYIVLARKRFAVALKTVHAALKQPRVSDLESVFKSVLLLSAFQLVSEPAGHAQDWSIHIEGGAALLQFMDAKRSRDIPIRQQLKLCLSVFSKYIIKKEPCSPSVLAWTKTCSNAIEEADEPAIRLTQLLISFTDLNASIGADPHPINQAALVAEVVALDAEMAFWENQLPEPWRCIQDPTCKDTLIYRDLWTSRIWNDYRWTRICINDLIIRHTFDPIFMEAIDATRIHRSLQTNAEMARGIYNSLYCGPISQGTSRVQASGHFLLLHPLVVAASGIGVPQDIHLAAVDKLMKMGTDMGVRQALHLADTAIKDRREWMNLLCDWVD